MLELLSVITVTSVSSVLGLITYYNNPKSATNRIFSIFAASIIFWAIIIHLSLQPFPPAQQLFFIRLSMLAAILMSTGVLFLSHTIPSDKFLMKKQVAVPLIMFAILGMITAMSPFMFTGLNIEGGNVEPITGPGMIMFLLTGLGYSVSGIFILLKRYRHSTGKLKVQLKYLLIGITIMHALLIYANFIVVLVFKSSSLMSYGPLFTLIFLVSAAYAIIKHRLMDIRLLVMRTVSFTILTILIAAIYGSTLYLISVFSPTQYETVLSIITAVILIFTFNPIKKVVQSLTKGIFYKDPYSPEELLETLGHITSSTLALDRLTNQTLKTLSKKMHISQAATIILEEEEHLHETNIGGKQLTHTPHNDLRTLLNNSKNMLIFEDLEEGESKQIMRDNHISVFAPLKTKNEIHGALLLGEKSSGDIYSQQDIDVLEIFIPQITVAIQNAKSYEEIKRFNITLREEVEAATKKLKEQNKHLKHLSKLKNEFIFIATHELKNPVAAIKGYLSMFKEGTFGEFAKETNDALNEMDVSTQQLVQLVNDLLQVARTESATLEINPQEINLCQIADTVKQNVKALADQKDINIEHACRGEDQLQIYADPDRVKEVFNNLFSNAIKYSEGGTITVSHHAQDGKVITHVKDQGVGISEEDQEKLFTRFFRAEEEAAKGIPGTGLGLYIIKQFIEKMGGEIWVESQKGKGSTFSFSLPTTQG